MRTLSTSKRTVSISCFCTLPNGYTCSGPRRCCSSIDRMLKWFYSLRAASAYTQNQERHNQHTPVQAASRPRQFAHHLYTTHSAGEMVDALMRAMSSFRCSMSDLNQQDIDRRAQKSESVLQQSLHLFAILRTVGELQSPESAWELIHQSGLASGMVTSPPRSTQQTEFPRRKHPERWIEPHARQELALLSWL